MGTWNGLRLAGAAGVVFVIGVVVSVVIVEPPPETGDPAAKFLEYYSDHRTVLLTQMVIGLLALIPAAVFAAGLWDLLRRDEGEGGVLATAAVIAFILGGAVVAVATGLPGGLAYLADGNGLDENSARTLSILGTMTCTSAIFAAFATTEAASGYVLLKGSILPRWLGWIGLAAGVLGLVGVFSVAKSGAFMPFAFFSFVAMIAFLLYVLLLSVFMFLRASEVRAVQVSAVQTGAPA